MFRQEDGKTESSDRPDQEYLIGRLRQRCQAIRKSGSVQAIHHFWTYCDKESSQTQLEFNRLREVRWGDINGPPGYAFLMRWSTSGQTICLDSRRSGRAGEHSVHETIFR